MVISKSSRILLIMAILLLCVAVSLHFAGQNRSKLLLFNHSDKVVENLVVKTSAGEFKWPKLGEREHVAIDLQHSGDVGMITGTFADGEPLHASWAYSENTGASTLHIYPDGTVGFP